VTTRGGEVRLAEGQQTLGKRVREEEQHPKMCGTVEKRNARHYFYHYSLTKIIVFLGKSPAAEDGQRAGVREDEHGLLLHLRLAVQILANLPHAGPRSLPAATSCT
jgi:hypothetical protein